MRYIQHIVEPERLLLSWQTSASGNKRGRMFVAELIRRSNNADLVYLKDSEDFINAQNLEFDGYPGFSIDRVVYENILYSFMKRLPPRSRGDFNRFLNVLRLKSDLEISDFALLGYSGAKLPDDDFTIINTFEDALAPFEFMLPVQGYRYYMKQLPLSALSTDMKAEFEAEPENAEDHDAVKIIIDGFKVGYVCRGLTTSFHKWIKSGLSITAFVERINGIEQKPNIYLYVSVK